MAEPATSINELNQNPYVGPRAFEEEERHFFFGRDEETEILTSLVMTRRSALFYAQSGAGKSSLLRAGLLPELTHQRAIGRGRHQRVYQKMHVLPIATVGGATPKEMDRDIANIYVFSALYAMQPDANPDELAGLTLSDGLKPLLRDPQQPEPDEQEDQTPPSSPARPHSRSRLSTLLIFDQFEEIFATHATRWPDRKAFFQQIRQTLADHQTLHVLFTMREDFIAELTPYLNLMPEQLRDRFRLERLQREVAIEAVKRPALQAGRQFAKGVAEGLVDNLRRSQAGQQGSKGAKGQGSLGENISPANEHDQTTLGHRLGEYIEPVHLQIVCRQLWEKLPPNHQRIEADDVQKFGDVDEALIGFYEDTLQKVVKETEVSERALRAWFAPPLITSADTRGLVYRGETETEGLANTAVDILNDAYIIRAEIRGSDTWYELAHDRLVEPILQANRAWEHRQQLQTRRIIPIIGNSMIYDYIFGSTEAVVEAWAEDTGYPLPSNNLELAQVAQVFRVHTNYYETTQHYLDSLKNYLLGRARDDANIYDEDLLAEAEEEFDNRTFSELAQVLGYPRSDNPLLSLADLPLPIYLTTSYHAFMESALVEAGKKPRTEICYWRDGLSHIPSVFDENPGYVPTAEEPLVYHLYGFDQYPESMVLTESDYLDFLVKTRTEIVGVIPKSVVTIMYETPPVLLGYKAQDYDLKILLESLLIPNRNEIPIGTMIQAASTETKEARKTAQYLERYFAELRLETHWGTTQSFIQEMWQL